MWGFNPQHTRFNPEARWQPPFDVSWRVRLGSLVEFPPVVDADGLFVQTGDGWLYALDPTTGDRRWRRRIAEGDQILASSPALDAESLWVTSLTAACRARRSAERQGALEGRGRLAHRVLAAPHRRPPLLRHRGRRALRHGRRHGQDPLAGAGGRRALKASPAYADGKLFIGAYDGRFYSFDAKTGKQLWSKESIGRLGGLSDGAFYSTPALAYGRVYVGSVDRRIYALQQDTGEIAWSVSTGDWVYSGPGVAYKMVFVGSYDDRFYALDARTGAVRWTFDAGADISGSPTIVDGVVYLSAFGRGSWGLDVRTGKVVWRNREGRYSPVVATRDAFYFTGTGSVSRLVPKR